MIPIVVAVAWTLAGSIIFVGIGFCHADNMRTVHEQDMARLAAPFAPPRQDLRYQDSDRVNDDYPARHRYGRAIGSAAQMAGIRALREPTGAFAVLVAANWDTGEREALAWRCDSCRIGWANEARCASCKGCGCPCRSPGAVAVGAR